MNNETEQRVLFATPFIPLTNQQQREEQLRRARAEIFLNTPIIWEWQSRHQFLQNLFKRIFKNV